MKRILSLLALFICMGLSAGNVFTVFRTQGNIQRRRIKETTWISVNRRDTVKLSDRIRIPADGMIRILESATGVIHTFSEKGEFTVKEMVDHSRKASSSLLKSVTGELGDEMRKKAATTCSYNSHGATHRGNEEEDKALEEFYNKIIQGDGSLSVRLVPDDDDSYRLLVDNQGEEGFISILCIRPSEAAFCLPAEGVLVGKGETLLLEPYVIPSSESRYVVFRVEGLYESGALLRLFRQPDKQEQ